MRAHGDVPGPPAPRHLFRCPELTAAVRGLVDGPPPQPVPGRDRVHRVPPGRRPAATSSATSAARRVLDPTGGGRPPVHRRPPGSPRRATVGDVGQQFGQGAPADLLVRLGQLPAERRRPARRRTPRPSPPGCRRSGAPTRRTPWSAARRPARPGPARRSPRLARQKALEDEPVAMGSPDSASAVITALGPGHRGHRQPGRGRGRHQPVPGIGDRRHPGIGDQHDRRGLDRIRSSSAGMPGTAPPPRSTTPIRPPTLTPRSPANRRSRRVSSAAMTSAAGQRLPQPGRGIGDPAERGAGQHQPAARADQVRADQVRTDQVRADRVRADRVRADRVRTDQIRTDQIRTAIPVSDTAPRSRSSELTGTVIRPPYDRRHDRPAVAGRRRTGGRHQRRHSRRRAEPGGTGPRRPDARFLAAGPGRP